MNKIRIVIADDVDETRDLLKQVLTIDNEHFEIVGEGRDGVEAVEVCDRLLPDIVLIDINMPRMNGLEATGIITEKHPNTNVIIMSVQSETEYLRSAMEAGAKGYILKPIDHEEVTELIQKTFDKSNERSKKIVTKSKEVEEVKEGKVISYYSFKGGVGKSVLALNSAVLISSKLKKKVALLDLDLHFGDISLLTNSQKEKTVLDLVDDDMVGNYDSIKQYLFNFSSDLDILFAPLNPEGADYVSQDIVKRIIDTIKTHYDIILIDTGVNFDEHTLYALDISESIFFVSSMEMTSLKNSKLGLKVMKSLNYGDEKVKIIVNQASDKFGIGKKDLEKVFEKKVFGFIDEDIKSVRFSVNKGVPLSDDPKYKGTKFNKSLIKICKEVI